jgi:hypothetical protein
MTHGSSMSPRGLNDGLIDTVTESRKAGMLGRKGDDE